MSAIECFAIKEMGGGIRMKPTFSEYVAEVVCVVDQTEVLYVLCPLS
jgi:hypothetical protein